MELLSTFIISVGFTYAYYSFYTAETYHIVLFFIFVMSINMTINYFIPNYHTLDIFGYIISSFALTKYNQPMNARSLFNSAFIMESMYLMSLSIALMFLQSTL